MQHAYVNVKTLAAHQAHVTDVVRSIAVHVLWAAIFLFFARYARALEWIVRSCWSVLLCGQGIGHPLIC